jgi:hypothetical protein
MPRTCVRAANRHCTTIQARAYSRLATPSEGGVDVSRSQGYDPQSVSSDAWWDV